VASQVLYDTLLDTNRIRGCTASDATMSREVGGKFSMFSGAVDGENVELRPFSESSGDAMIKWKWRFSTWQPDHYSTVTITLTDKDGATKLELVQVRDGRLDHHHHRHHLRHLLHLFHLALRRLCRADGRARGGARAHREGVEGAALR
jgi:hypothetical protein